MKDPEVYKYFYKHEHPAPALLKESVYGLPEAYRDQIRGRQVSGVSRLLSDEHSCSAAAARTRKHDPLVKYRCEQLKRSERRGPESGCGFAFC